MKHHILVKWNDSVGDRLAMIPRVEEAFRDAVNIPGVSGCEVIPSCSDRPNRYDVMIRMELTPEGLLNYDASSMHKVWKEQFTVYMASKAIFDCD